jgi:hypothetical protein
MDDAAGDVMDVGGTETLAKAIDLATIRRVGAGTRIDAAGLGEGCGAWGNTGEGVCGAYDERPGTGAEAVIATVGTDMGL